MRDETTPKASSSPMSAIRSVFSTMEDHIFIACGPKGSNKNSSSNSVADNDTEKVTRRRNAMIEAAKSKTGLWGPTHSLDSSEDATNHHRNGVDKPSSSSSPETANNSTETTKAETLSSTERSSPTRPVSPTRPIFPVPLPPAPTALERLYESAAAAVGVITPTAASFKQRMAEADEETPQQQQQQDDEIPSIRRSSEMLAVLIEDACSPCSHPNEAFNFNPVAQPTTSSLSPDNVGIGIAPMEPPGGSPKDACSISTPASRRRQRHFERQLLFQEEEVEEEEEETPPANLPVQTLTLRRDEAMERSISELTMRSSYGEATAVLAANRRMAYYAVGKHHKNAGRGGNRRCYFTGKLILGGAPFYAGSVQQGLRTLVVFCLPSALGLPKHLHQEGDTADSSRRDGLMKDTSAKSFGTRSTAVPAAVSLVSRESSIGITALPRIPKGEGSHRSLKAEGSLRSIKGEGSFRSLKPEGSLRSLGSRGGGLKAEGSLRSLRRKRTHSSAGTRLSSLDDMSLSIEEEDDLNWGLDREYLLKVLPEPSQDLLDTMADRYPEQFETLPVQVRSPHCWRLFVKFCFFSGLPIAEGEMHYKVPDDVANDVYGEEIILSHEVMEAANGESAEILRLPNMKTFRYLRKHYTQQSGKLPDTVFKRQSWEIVLPEV